MVSGEPQAQKKKSWNWNDQSIWWKIIPGVLLALVLLAEAFLLLGGNRLLYRQVLVGPGVSHVVAPYGDVGNQDRGRLVCHYFTGRSTQTQLVWYDPANEFGLDECPVVTDQMPLYHTLIGREGESNLADWAGLGAVIFAALGYFTVEFHRWRERRKQDQDTAYQIMNKVTLLLTDAHTCLKSLTLAGFTPDQLQNITSPFQIVGMQEPVKGLSPPMAENLSDSERNLLLRLREEEFLMVFTECYAQNLVIHAGIQDYTKILENINIDQLKVVGVAPRHMVREFSSYEAMADAYPEFYGAAHLIKTLRARAMRNVRKMNSLAGDYGPLMKKHFPRLHIHEIEIFENDQYDDELEKIVIDPLDPKPTVPRIPVNVSYMQWPPFLREDYLANCSLGAAYTLVP